MKPIEVFQSLLLRISLWTRRYKNVPGEVVKSLSSEERDALSRLKTSDINDLRDQEYHIFAEDQRYYQREEERKLRLNFDKTLKNERKPR